MAQKEKKENNLLAPLRKLEVDVNLTMGFTISLAKTHPNHLSHIIISSADF